MSTQAPIFITPDVWVDVSAGMEDSLRYLISNEGSEFMKIFEGLTPPPNGSDEPGHSFSGRGGEMFVTKQVDNQCYVYSRQILSAVVVSERA